MLLSLLTQSFANKGIMRKSLLNNIRNIELVLEDWDFVMAWAGMRLHPTERDLFNVVIHMFPTNNLVSLHNRHMLKSLNYPIA